MSGATPDIFRIVDKTWETQTPKAVLDATREDGILSPLLDFFEAGTDCLKESKDLDNDRVKYETLADSFGSNAYKNFREDEIKAAEAAKKAQAKKVVNNAVKK
ncbi:MAG: hypothetical protein J6I58_03245 [Eubacterium sp.]|nr:hypothetical protein [Eubacterium sp.]